MRLRIADRVLVALAGLLLLACCAGIVAQMFFGVDLVGIATKVFSSEAQNVRIALIALAVFLFLLGLYCLFVLFRHRKRKDKFILQKNESGELAISLKALENMVQKCVDQHDELKVQHTYLENRKDGLLIRIRGGVAGGVSIPLTVEALQKQIRQYVTACSGVEVKGIRVQIESSGPDAKDAPFAIAAPAPRPLLHEGQEKQPAVQQIAEPEEAEQNSAEPAPAPQPESAPAAPDPVPAPAPAPVVVEEEDDDRPLHQRLFSKQPEPCIIPEPPMEEEADEVVSEFTKTDGEPADEAENDAVVSTENAKNQDTLAESAEEDPEDVKLEADPEFLDSLKTFDDLITGEAKEAEEE